MCVCARACACPLASSNLFHQFSIVNLYGMHRTLVDLRVGSVLKVFCLVIAYFLLLLGL